MVQTSISVPQIQIQKWDVCDWCYTDYGLGGTDGYVYSSFTFYDPDVSAPNVYHDPIGYYISDPNIELLFLTLGLKSSI